VIWHIERNGETCSFRPDIGKSNGKRNKAREFARKWRTDDGRLCFTAPLERFVQMVEGKAGVPSFPTLSYTYHNAGPTATAEVEASRIQAFHIGRFRDHRNASEDLKQILREYGVSMTGNKETLLRKLAKLAVEQYREKKPALDAFFAKQRFLRISSVPSRTTDLPILGEVHDLRNLLLSMYAMKHLRGNAVLEASHENNSYTEEQLALALLAGRAGLSGSFLRVA